MQLASSGVQDFHYQKSIISVFAEETSVRRKKGSIIRLCKLVNNPRTPGLPFNPCYFFFFLGGFLVFGFGVFFFALFFIEIRC